MSELVYYRDLDEQLLVFPVLGVNVGIELKYVKSISLTSELIPIPRSPKYILGIVNIDSNIYPIVDLDVLLSGQMDKDLTQTIVSLIDIKNTVFGIHTQQLPHVVPGAVGEANGSVKKIPEEWILGYTEHAELGIIPILNPRKFWIDLGEKEMTGPLLNTTITSADLNPDAVEMEKAIQTEEPEIPEETNKMETASENEIFQLEGIGQKVKEDLLAAGFDSIEKLANASTDDLTAVNGVGKKTAENIAKQAKGLLGNEEEQTENSQE